MVGVPPEYEYDFWDKIESFDRKLVTLTCLMPNGIIILLNTSYNATLAEVKEDLWDEAAKQPLYGKLHDMSVYVFVCISSALGQEKINDEGRRLCDIRPVGATLSVKECIADKADETTNLQIGQLIGKRLQEFDQINSPEINDFRFKMRKLGEEIVQARQKLSWQQRVFYQFPPRLNKPNKNISDVIEPDKNIKITSKFENYESSFTFNVPPSIKPKKLLEIILSKKANIMNMRNERACDFVLKVCGRDEYLVGDYPIIDFQYIQDALSRDLIPTLVTVNVVNVPVVNDNEYECLNSFDKKPRGYSTLTLRKKGKYKSSWDILESFRITLCTATKLNCDIKKNPEVFVGMQVALFHGGKSLCESRKTEETKVNVVGEQCEAEFKTTLEFNIKVGNIPKNSKICFGLYEIVKTGRSAKFKKAKEMGKDTLCNPLAWGNTTVYDFKNQLKTGAMTLYLWSFADDMISDDFLHPLGTVVSNPDTRNSTALTLNFESYGGESNNQTILFPSREAILRHSQERPEAEYKQIIDRNNIQSCYKVIVESENLYEVHDQERKNIWDLKYHWRENFPEILPKLLYCIDWDNKDVVSDVVVLLKDWPLLPPEKALELLDYAYADQDVRSYAVRCLRNLSDEDLLLYLLQLVQALKHELFLECDLVNFLLRRALNNQKIGHYLFWHLRSEMQVPSVSVRFGLILEAYCRGSQEHMPALQKQVNCLEKMKKCSELVRTRRDKEKGKALLKEYLADGTTDFMGSFRNPLEPSFRCKRIKIDRCKVMDSKMKPLWIVFENFDTYGEDIYIIFKNGDDLRQDMLTLQMLRVMDKIWKQEGLDFRMNPYNCISIENRVGLIEVVLNADTIANIQKEKGMFCATSAFRKGSILAWLKDYNTTEAALNKAVEEFTLSCAGYCVATYVLGIGDRHSDNIMVKKNGQLFHIDFGHILGHFKEKFGIKRERVPFVLTHDFVYVINKGQKTGLEFKAFQEYCEKAFLILRKHGFLFISLCAMMISTGLPELSSERDLNYLKETLVLSKTEDDALQHFRNKFFEALSNSWKTSLNWASHNLAKNNKG